MVAITKYKSRSGKHWDNENGANITTDADKVVWEAYLKGNTVVRHTPHHYPNIG